VYSRTHERACLVGPGRTRLVGGTAAPPASSVSAKVSTGRCATRVELRLAVSVLDIRLYDEPADISDELDRAEDAIEEQAAEEQEEDEFFDLDDAGFCPVCSIEQGKKVPIPYGQTCACGGYENVSVDHENPNRNESELLAIGSRLAWRSRTWKSCNGR
jgi:hypothetical protein